MSYKLTLPCHKNIWYFKETYWPWRGFPVTWHWLHTLTLIPDSLLLISCIFDQCLTWERLTDADAVASRLIYKSYLTSSRDVTLQTDGASINWIGISNEILYFPVVQILSDGEEGLQRSSVPQLDARLLCLTLLLPAVQEPGTIQLPRVRTHTHTHTPHGRCCWSVFSVCVCVSEI